MIYEEIEEIIRNIFAARAKNVSDKVVSVWAKEISLRNFCDLGLKDSEKQLMEDDEIDLTLPKVLAIMYKNNMKYKKPVEKLDCQYCNGLGYVYNTISFNKEGKYNDYHFALKCYHNNVKNTCTQMVFNEETHHKTDIKNGYVLVFKDIVEKEEYLNKVKENGWNDLWVVEKPKGELVPFYPLKEEEMVGEDLVIPDPEEYVPDDDVPF